MTALQLVNRLLENDLEDLPDDWEGDYWRNDSELSDLAAERSSDLADTLFSGKFKKLGDLSHVPLPPDAEYDASIAASRAAGKKAQELGAAKFKQAVPDLKWWALLDEEPPHYSGEVMLMHGKLTGGPRDGEVIDPAFVAQTCANYGIHVIGLLPKNITRATIRDRMAALANTGDLADAFTAKYKKDWMSAVDHDLELNLFTLDDDYGVDVSIPVDDPQAVQKAIAASKIFKQVAKVFSRVWPGMRWP